MVMILSLLLYLYEAVLKKYKFHAYFYTSALIFYFTKKADKMQVLFIKKSEELCLKQGRFDCLPKVLRDTKPTEQATLNTRFNLVDI